MHTTFVLLKKNNAKKTFNAKKIASPPSPLLPPFAAPLHPCHSGRIGIMLDLIGGAGTSLRASVAQLLDCQRKPLSLDLGCFSVPGTTPSTLGTTTRVLGVVPRVLRVVPRILDTNTPPVCVEGNFAPSRVRKLMPHCFLFDGCPYPTNPAKTPKNVSVVHV